MAKVRGREAEEKVSPTGEFVRGSDRADPSPFGAPDFVAVNSSFD